jgi:membrane peptidoglycan carboxypeptidase
MTRLRRWLRWIFLIVLVLALIGAAAVGGLYYAVSSKLPDVQTLRDVEMQEPMYVYAADGKLMAVFGETRRTPITMKDVPEKLKQAFLATEDARFYEHGGVDYMGIGRAVWLLATTSDKRVPGGSTITQQVARQFFLGSEYSYTRKLAEILLARKIESELSKDEIFELYLNKSFFGNRAYGGRRRRVLLRQEAERAGPGRDGLAGRHPQVPLVGQSDLQPGTCPPAPRQLRAAAHGRPEVRQPGRGRRGQGRADARHRA